MGEWFVGNRYATNMLHIIFSSPLLTLKEQARQARGSCSSQSHLLWLWLYFFFHCLLDGILE